MPMGNAHGRQILAAATLLIDIAVESLQLGAETDVDHVKTPPGQPARGVDDDPITWLHSVRRDPNRPERSGKVVCR